MGVDRGEEGVSTTHLEVIESQDDDPHAKEAKVHNTTWLVIVTVVFLLPLSSVLPPRSTAAPVAPQDAGVYEEDFPTRDYLDYTSDASRAMANQHLRLSPAFDNISGARGAE